MAPQVVNFRAYIGSHSLTCVGIDDKVFFKVFDVNKFVGLDRYYSSSNVRFPKTSVKDMIPTVMDKLPLASPRLTVTWKLFDVETCLKFVASRNGNRSNLLKTVFADDAPVVYAICTGQRSKLVKKRMPQVAVLGKDHPLKSTGESMSRVLKKLQEAHGCNPLLQSEASNLETLPESPESPESPSQCIYDPSLLSPLPCETLVSEPLRESETLEPAMSAPGEKRSSETDEDSRPDAKRLKSDGQTDSTIVESQTIKRECESPSHLPPTVWESHTVKTECQSPSHLPETVVETPSVKEECPDDTTECQTDRPTLSSVETQSVKEECPDATTECQTRTDRPTLSSVETRSDLQIMVPSRITLTYNNGTRLCFNVSQNRRL